MVEFMVKFGTTLMFTFFKKVEKWKSLKNKKCWVLFWREEEDGVHKFELVDTFYNIFIDGCFITR